MLLPISGRTVVIDDNINEALPIIQLLSKHNVPNTYYSGEEALLPESTSEGIRLVISDLHLGSGNDIKTFMSTLNHIITEIISDTNGPYILLLWTKHKLDCDEAIDYINKRFVRKPIDIFPLDKNSCIKIDGDKYLIEDNAMGKIESNFRTVLEKASAMHLFILWENLVHVSAGKLVSDFSSLDQSENWNAKMDAVFFALAKVLGGKQYNPGETDVVAKYSLLTFTNTFIDVLENNIRRYTNFNEVKLDDNLKIRETISSRTFEIEPKTVATINSMLMLEEINGLALEHRPGNLYINESNGELKRLFGKMVYDSSNPDAIEIEASKRLQNYSLVADQQERTQKSFEKEIIFEIKEKSKLCLLEISPLCDYSQNKWEAHRVIRGLVWPREHMDKVKTNTDFLYTTPLFELNGESFCFIFNFCYFTSIRFGELHTDQNIIFTRVRQQLLVDIQSKLAKHINRPGILSLT